MFNDWILKLSDYQCLTLTNTPPTWCKEEVGEKRVFEWNNTFPTIFMHEHLKLFYYYQAAVHVNENCVMFLSHLPSEIRVSSNDWKWKKYIAILCNTLNWISPEWLIVFDLIWQRQQAFRPNSIHNLIQFSTGHCRMNEIKWHHTRSTSYTQSEPEIQEMKKKKLSKFYMHNIWICSFSRFQSGFQSELCQKNKYFLR